MSRFKEKLTDKRWVFLGVIVLLLLVFAWKAIPFENVLYMHRPIKMTLNRSKDTLTQLMGPRNTETRGRMFIDVIAFKRMHELVHEHIGRFGIKQNFYIDFETVMEVEKDGNFIFTVNSDDGFRLLIDDKECSVYNGPRSMELPTPCTVFLTAGSHNLKMEYYQGDGELGLKAKYSVQGMGGEWLIGQTSQWMKFRKP